MILFQGNSDRLRDMFADITLCAAKDSDHLPNLAAVQFEAISGVLEIAATDRYTLAVWTVETAAEDFKGLVNAKELTTALKLAPKNRDVAVRYESDGLRLVWREGDVKVSFIDYHFPKYRETVPVATGEASVDRLYIAPKVMSLLAKTKTVAQWEITFTGNNRPVMAQGVDDSGADSSLRVWVMPAPERKGARR